MGIPFQACKERVGNRGHAPDQFLEELVAWARTADPGIFAPNNQRDIYADISAELGPWKNDLHRKAVMLEVLRVLAGRESSWHWDAGRDFKNAKSNTPCTEEAGIFQCSGDSMSQDASLKALLVAVAGNDDCDTFRHVTKTNHSFAIEYCARLLRFTTQHHGPIKHRRLHRWLSREAVREFEARL